MNCLAPVPAGFQLEVNGEFTDGFTETFYVPVRFVIANGQIESVRPTMPMTITGEVREVQGKKVCSASLRFHAMSDVLQGPFDNREGA